MAFERAAAMTGWRVETLASIHDVPAAQWDLCVDPDDVFVSHRHLAALEDSRIAAPENGFTPNHVVLHDLEGGIVAAAPAYLKTHSRAELGVDLGLQLAHERLVGAYYPKLQVEVPMTVHAGSRLLVRAGVDRGAAVRALAAALQEVAADRGASSVQIAFMDPRSGDPEILRDMEMAVTENNTFVWHAGEDTCFETFFRRMKKRRRDEVRRERRAVKARGLNYRYFRGPDLRPEMGLRFYDHYLSTFERHATEPWLNAAYFQRVFETMPEVVDLSVSFDGDAWAGAVFSMNGPTRGHVVHWGQTGDIRYLHFEQLFYRSIERAFVTGLETVDFAGTGGHKAVRGLRPEPVMHALWFRDAAMREVTAAACRRKTVTAEAERAAETARMPFAAERDGDGQ